MSSAASQLVFVAQDIFLAPAPTSSAVEDSPKLVVLFGWMGAQLPHLRKYIALHHEQFPSTPVLLIRCRPQQFFVPQSFRLRSLQPALSHLPSSGILFHVVSNGGCSRLTDLLALRRILPNSRSAILFDSCPGARELEPSLIAFLSPFKSPLIRFIGRIILTLVFFLFALFNVLLNRGDSLDRIRQPLNDPSKVDLGSPRAYVYSGEDELVQDWAVEAHAAQAQERGYTLTLHKFQGSRHAQHLKKGAEQYKKAVRDLWNSRAI